MEAESNEYEYLATTAAMAATKIICIIGTSNSSVKTIGQNKLFITWTWPANCCSKDH
jgi:hypothetical protein